MVEVFPILGQAPAPSKPCEGAFDHPAPGQDDKTFGSIRALDDLHIHLRHDFLDGAAKLRPLIAAIGVEFQKERIEAKHRRHEQCAAITILDVGGMDDGVDQQALRVDKNVPLLALDLFSRIVTRRIDGGPPFSALFTLWLSITAAVGLASRATASRHLT